MSGPVEEAGGTARALLLSETSVVGAFALMPPMGASIFTGYASCRPSHISRLVITVIVDAVNHEMRGWSFADIGQEIGEVVPAFANGNAASSIILVSLVVLIGASIAHAVPYVIQRRVPTTVTKLAEACVLIATAGLKTTAPKLAQRARAMSVSAVALTKPLNLSVFVSAIWPHCYQSAITLSRNILWLGHRTAPSVRGQVAGSVPQVPIQLRSIA